VVKRARKPPKPAAGRRVSPAVAVVLTLGIIAAALFGLSRLGEEARRNLGERERYAVKFADIRCEPPPGTPRDTFLAEVRYAANAPPTFQALDPNLSATLTSAFAAHPWVAGVESVVVEPPDVVTVKLSYRVPVLAIGLGNSKRAVDAKGILLPPSAPTANLPELLSAPALPSEALAGKPWPDGAVVSAAAVAAEYKPRTMEHTAQGWQLVMPDGKKLTVAGK
jgi:hypothetical protein